MLACGTLAAQRYELNAQFGANAILPVVNPKAAMTSKFTHNFWIGLSFKTPVNNRTDLHIGAFTNGVNYRFSSADSPTTTFITMNYLSMPVQLELLSKNRRYGFLFGAEPKWYISGHQYTAEPSVSQRINFKLPDNNYNIYNLGCRMGVEMHLGEICYFLQASSDLFPFRNIQGTRFTDRKLIFGFTMFPILPRRRK